MYGWVHILNEDPDLGATLDPEAFAQAKRVLRAPVAVLEGNRPQLPECDPRTTFGLLILSGLMGRRVGIGAAHATELLGPGDILRPWEHDDQLESLPAEVRWRVFTPVRVAVLGSATTRLIGQRPELLVAFSGRLLLRVRCGAYLTAVSHLARIDEKVLVTLWHLASRWGRVTPGGVELAFRITHAVIGEIVGARRPTVTLALNRMFRREILLRGARGELILPGSPDGWTLAGLAQASPVHEKQPARV